MYGGVYRPIAFRPFLEQLPGPRITPKFTIVRPISTITAASWDTGPTPAGNLFDNTSDEADATWIEDALA